MQVESYIIQYFISQGPFAVLFIWLLYKTQKRNEEREQQLTETLAAFAERYDVVIERLDDIDKKLPDKDTRERVVSHDY